MNKLFACAFALSFASVSATMHAATVSELNLKAKASAAKTCNTATCEQIVKASYSVTETIALTQQERSALDAQTRIQINYDAGISMDFHLADDSGFATGDTSAHVTTTSLFIGTPDSSLVQSADLDWSSGAMVIRVSTKLNALLQADVDQPVAPLAVQSLRGKAADKVAAHGYVYPF